jgi:3-deoxy-7-phosphoheptulonate synthase
VNSGSDTPASVHQTSDINVALNRVLPSPADLIGSIPRNQEQSDFIVKSRQTIHGIIFGNDPRLLLVVGPCSIHDVDAGREYADRLAKLAAEVSDRFFVAMRVYFEKPRTTVGWKGLIMDPKLDDSADIPAGLSIARNFLREVINAGVPTSTELLDPITPQYIADLICWSAIGARTTESQTHRQMASGLSMPLGFKNATDGSIDVAVNAIQAAGHSQTFLGVSLDGRASAVTTRGNPNCHVVLRGGRAGPNYDADSITKVDAELKKAGLFPAIMVDCSHDNSGKKPENQGEVFLNVINQAANGRTSIIGAMLESNLEAGKQKFPAPLDSLKRGVSITDGCIGWDETEKLIRQAYDRIANRFA